MLYGSNKAAVEVMMEDDAGFQSEYGDVYSVEPSKRDKGFVSLFINGKHYQLDVREAVILASALRRATAR